MSIGVIALLKDYFVETTTKNHYLQCKIVRYPGTSYDNHEIQELNNELMKGVYI